MINSQKPHTHILKAQLEMVGRVSCFFVTNITWLRIKSLIANSKNLVSKMQAFPYVYYYYILSEKTSLIRT